MPSYRRAALLTRPYRFYCKLNKGKNEIRVEATLKNHNRYPFSGYVKIEKILKPEASVRLHYGKARVFVKTKSKKRSYGKNFGKVRINYEQR